MKLSFFRASCAISVACVLSTGVAHADYPERAITLIVPTAPGGGNDILARVVGQKMGALLGQTVIVLNKPGAQGAIAAEHVARQPADGYTLMLGYIGTHGINPALQSLKYDPVKDFTPIGMVAESPTLLVVSNSIGVQDVADLVKYGREHPEKLNFASAGAGTALSVAGELFNRETRINMLDVPYKGSAPALSDTLAGNTQVMFPSLFSVYPHLTSGKIRALAVAGSKRVAVLPDLPTLAEAGVPGVEVPQWYAMFAPANLPAEMTQQLNAALNQALSDPIVISKIDEQGAEVRTSTAHELGIFVQGEVARWRNLLTSTQLAVR